MTLDTKLPDPLTLEFDRLARFESRSLPVLSLYLDARADARGRDHYQPFVRKELAARQRTYSLRSPERKSFDRDVEKIQAYLENQARPSTNGIAMFACSGAGDFFEPFQFEAVIEENHLAVMNRPQLFPLARVLDQNPRYALVLADTHSAQILVFAFGFRIDEAGVDTVTLPHTRGTGLSAMRYQRHVEKHQKEHARELVERLERIAEQDRIDHIVLAGNDVILPLIRHELPKRLEEKLVDALHFDRRKPLTEAVRAATEALRRHDAKSDAERVRQFLDAYRAGGLAAAGPEDVRSALEKGEADEVLVSAAFDKAGADADKTAGELLALAGRTAARITLIEDATLLEPVEGVGAFLRYRTA